MKRAWEIIRKNVKTSGTEILGYYDLKQHKPWFDGDSKTIRSAEAN
jgi:hypothetical protein